MSSNKWPLTKKTFCLITGASRGLGKVLAVKMGAKLANGSVLCLLARDIDRLEATKDQVLLERSIDGLKVHCSSLDFSKSDKNEFTKAINTALEKTNDFDEAIIIHNAATVGHPKRILKYNDPVEWAAYMELNLTSAVCLNYIFLEMFAAVQRKLVLNISSKAAICPTGGLSMYCAGKAARELYFKTLAIEEPEVIVLNYAPGPLSTDMFYGIIEQTKDSDPSIACHFQKMISDGLVISCETSTARLLGILETGSFSSGDHIDFYD